MNQLDSWLVRANTSIQETRKLTSEEINAAFNEITQITSEVAEMETLFKSLSRRFQVKFRFSKKATKFETISYIYLVVNVKSSGRLFQIFKAFSECPNFNKRNKKLRFAPFQKTTLAIFEQNQAAK